ncbi:hypothetical protein [Methanobrevibacter sp.]|uniref:hypothetical protein n=1 Tax=Methanobrevibacter sp. TaxID=66852 RepID=UPI0025DF2F92|nr:hypothetical protein [Methanobrevibacter sp.]MBQ2832423.1 hypothetical protein [Methanobrevibacter sp.]
MNESKVSMKEFRELTKDIPDEYMLYFSLDNVPYGTECFIVDVPEKRIILK